MIIGPAISGKSTLVFPFDGLFGFDQVFLASSKGQKFEVQVSQSFNDGPDFQVPPWLRLGG